ncbi:MAG: magnesium transporter, partial [Bacilli bacterium]|nr:magnesium transporter [Bacilli bacterium]
MEIEEMVSKILELIKEKKIREIKKELSSLEEIDIAEVMNELPLDANLLLVFRLLDKDVSTEIFANLDSEEQEYIINSITDKEISTIIEDLFTDDAVDMLEEMPATVVKRVLKNATPDTRNLINQFLKYPDSSAGSVMTSEFVDLKSNMTVSEAVNHLRKVAKDKETIYTCYVTDKTRILEGVVSIRDMLLANSDDLLKDIMEKDIISAHTLDDQEAVAQDFAKYDLIALPVLDNEERLVGIITIDDIVDVMTEEATEDIMKMNAIVPTEDPYLKTSVFKIAKSRIVWLMILMFTSIISGLILDSFENAISALPFL